MQYLPLKIILTSVLLFTWFLLTPVSTVEAATKALILNYHHLDPKPTTSSTISPQLFTEHMSFLKEKGYNIISLQDLRRYLLSETQSLPERAVVITFDDGYESFYQYAYPILQKYNYPSTMFTIVSKVGNKQNEVPKLTWDEIKSLATSNLVDFQSHTYNMHYQVKNKSPLLWQNNDQVEKDLRLAQDVLAFYTGRLVDMVAYPYSQYRKPAIDVANKEGYRLGFTLKKGTVQRGMNLMELPRVAVGEEKYTVKELEKILNHYLRDK